MAALSGLVRVRALSHSHNAHRLSGGLLYNSWAVMAKEYAASDYWLPDGVSKIRVYDQISGIKRTNHAYYMFLCCICVIDRVPFLRLTILIKEETWNLHVLSDRDLWIE